MPDKLKSLHLGGFFFYGRAIAKKRKFNGVGFAALTPEKKYEDKCKKHLTFLHFLVYYANVF